MRILRICLRGGLGLFSTFLVTFFIVSCAQHKIISSWKNDSIPRVVLDDILVIGQAKHPTTRRIFENAFVEELLAENVVANASHTISKESIALTKEALLEVIKKTDAKTVLITRFVDRQVKTNYQDSVMRTPSAYEEPYGAYFSAPAPLTSATRTYVYLESNVYDVKSEQLLWSATAKCIDPVMTNTYMGEITDMLIADLKLKGLL